MVENSLGLFLVQMAVTVEIVDLKGTLELVVHIAGRGDLERAQEFAKIQAVVFVAVEYGKYAQAKLVRLGVGIKLSIHVFELLS